MRLVHKLKKNTNRTKNQQFHSYLQKVQRDTMYYAQSTLTVLSVSSSPFKSKKTDKQTQGFWGLSLMATGQLQLYAPSLSM